MSQLDLNQIEELASNLRAVSDETYSAAVAVADVYNATSSYDIGDYCIKSTLLYKCNTAIASGEAWDSGHWDEICVSDELNEIRSSVIHVGTAAPSNPNVQLWLDTDEPGASVVNSVNGKNGTVVLDLGDIGFAELLWTNASPGSSFAAQTVALDLSNYDIVYILFAISTTSWGQNNFMESFGMKGFSILKSHVDNTGNRMNRAYSTSNSGVTFESGYNNGSESNSNLLPRYIYGAKGVQT